MKAGSVGTFRKNRWRFCSISFLRNPGNLLGPVLQRAGEIKMFRASKPGQSRAHIADPVFSTLVRYLRSEEHTSELQSRGHLVCRLLLEKKNFLYYSSSIHNSISPSIYSC